jgi:hypothetical protein
MRRNALTIPPDSSCSRTRQRSSLKTPPGRGHRPKAAAPSTAKAPTKGRRAGQTYATTGAPPTSAASGRRPGNEQTRIRSHGAGLKKVTLVHLRELLSNVTPSLHRALAASEAGPSQACQAKVRSPVQFRPNRKLQPAEIAASTQVLPPSVGIYTADASAHVAVEVRVFDQGDAPSNELGTWFEVVARSSVATHILIVTHSAPVVPASNQFTAFSESSADRTKYLAEFTLPVNRSLNLGPLHLWT